MADKFTKEKRSEVISRIRGKGNKSTELALLQIFRGYHITGWRRNRPVFGRPDFVFPKKKVAVFVDGCFWHGCPKHLRPPKTNRDFWRRKVGINKGRDRSVNRELRKRGWVVIRIWEHAFKEQDRIVNRIERKLKDKD